MVLLVEKLGRSLRFPSNLEKPHLDSYLLSVSLLDFRSKIADFIAQKLLNSDQETGLLSLTGFTACFQLIHATTSAFAKLVAEIDHPMTRWGPKLTDEYLAYTLNLMDLLNAVNSSVSHLCQAKLSTRHAVTLLRNSPSSQPKCLKNIPAKGFKFEMPVRVEEKPCCQNESVLLQALILSKKIGVLALGFVVSGLCCNGKPYMDVRELAGWSGDSLVRDLDSRFCKEVTGIMEEVKEVNTATERLSVATPSGRYSEAVDELERRLKVMDDSIQIIEKQSNDLFSQVLSRRNKMMDNIRFSG